MIYGASILSGTAWPLYFRDLKNISCHSFFFFFKLGFIVQVGALQDCTNEGVSMIQCQVLQESAVLEE